MYTDTLNISYFRKDATFDTLYPQHIRDLSQMHWTALDVALEASNFLATPGARVLDIGSGVGKFCISAAVYHPDTDFFGIEQRKDLFNHANAAKEQIGVENAQNIEPGSRIDYAVKTSFELYNYYTEFIHDMLSSRPTGTRLATYHAPDKQIPPSYKLIDNSYSRVLKMWVKE
jgi:2-polyprenyl-3-methyl-5-hydroxy-6-metoxy-1,4-benzoquinol methylase